MRYLILPERVNTDDDNGSSSDVPAYSHDVPPLNPIFNDRILPFEYITGTPQNVKAIPPFPIFNEPGLPSAP